jgi:hypothetical protein
MMLAEEPNMIQALAPERSDQTFSVRVLPRRPLVTLADRESLGPVERPAPHRVIQTSSARSLPRSRRRDFRKGQQVRQGWLPVLAHHQRQPTARSDLHWHCELLPRPRTARCGSVMRAWASRSEHPHEAGGLEARIVNEPPRFRDRDVRLLLRRLPSRERAPASEIEPLIVMNERLADRRHPHTRPTM